MVEEFWNELVEFLMPNLRICPRSTEHNAEEFFWTQLKLDGWGNIQWKFFPKNCRVNSPDDIIPTIEKLLNRRTNRSDLIVYIHSMYDLDNVIKTELGPILKNYIDMPWTDKTCIWNPKTGYVIEDLGSGDITVGIVPKQAGPEAYFVDHKKTSEYNFPGFTNFYYTLSKNTDIPMVLDQEANTILASFQTKFPLTRWGKIDWDKIEKKLAIGRDQGKIIPALEQLSDKTVSMTAYINWCNADFPLIKIDLREAVTNYDQIVAVALETVLFNPVARYVVEINIFGDITVGVL